MPNNLAQIDLVYVAAIQICSPATSAALRHLASLQLASQHITEGSGHFIDAYLIQLFGHSGEHSTGPVRKSYDRDSIAQSI